MDTAGMEKGRSLNVSSELKKAMIQAIKESSLSRPQIVDKMNEFLQAEGLEEDVSLDVLNSWTKEDPRRIIPTRLIPFFCKATHSIEPITALARVLGALVIQGDQLNLLELGIAEYEKIRAQQREARALSNLGIKLPARAEK